jgi:hypothetical protein
MAQITPAAIKSGHRPAPSAGLRSASSEIRPIARLRFSKSGIRTANGGLNR